MTTLRTCTAATAIGLSGAAVMMLSWWAILVALPCVVVAFAVDGRE